MSRVRYAPSPAADPPGVRTLHLIDPAAPVGGRYRGLLVAAADWPVLPAKIEHAGRRWRLNTTHFDPPAYEPAE